MKPIQLLRATALLVCIASLPLAHASDFTGLYARVEKVVLEPSSGEPERIQIWGVFSLASPNNTNDYLPAARGYVYLKLVQNPQATRNEWNDLKQVAGSGEIVAFGVRFQTPKLRKAGENPKEPDPYVINFGVVKVRGRTDYAPVKSILDFHE